MSALKFFLAAAVLGYVAIALVVYLLQDNLLFYPQPPLGKAVPPPRWQLQDVRVTARDGTPLEGVLVKPAGLPPAAPLVIYYGGNAEEVTAYAGLAGETYGERAVLFVNYRGYGRSGGKPGERALVSDALEVFDWAAKRPDIDPARIALHGRSLGSGVAVQVAAARPARCVVLTSPFDSARDIAKKIYPWLPVALLLRHPFDSAALAPKLRQPALILMGDADDLIPMTHSERLASLWGGAVERVVLPGFGHNDVSINPKYLEAIRAFLARCH